MTFTENENGSMLPVEFTNSENKSIHMVMDNEKPWFVANDVCNLLEIANSRDAISKLHEDEKRMSVLPTPSGRQNTNLIDESGFYALVFQSRKPQAQKLRRWVTDEVLPSLRRTGAYEISNYGQAMYVMNQPFFNYKENLIKIGLSIRSGSFSQRIRKYPQHFILSEEKGRWLITKEYLDILNSDKKLRDARQAAKTSDTIVKFCHPALRPQMQLSLFDEEENYNILQAAVRNCGKKIGDLGNVIKL